MNDCFKYAVTDSIKLHKEAVIVNEQIKCTNSKEVYKVITNVGNKEIGILKAIYSATKEALNTLSFYMSDTNSYFVEMIDYYKDDNKIFLLLKYYNNGSLYTIAQKDSEYLEDSVKNSYIKQILDIGCYLHKNGYIHCDIKPDNFFIDDKHNVRLGDLETLVKSDDIYSVNIKKKIGTKGFKYSDTNYSLNDEIFAFIATIFYIETGELLITPDEYDAKEHNKSAINSYAIDSLEIIEREDIANILAQTIDKLDNNEKIDCCYLKQEFLKLFKSYEEKAKEDKIATPVSQTTLKPKKSKKKKKLIKSPSSLTSKAFILTALVAFILISLLVMPKLSNSSIECDKAYMLKKDVIYVKKGVNTYYYQYKNGNFDEIKDSRVLELSSQPITQDSENICDGGIVNLNY